MTTLNTIEDKFSIGITTIINGEYDTIWISNNDVIECYFVEDIYSYIRTGKLTFYDRNGIMEFGSLITGTEIQILFGVGSINDSIGDSYTLVTLEVYKSNRVLPTGPNSEGKVNMVELILVEPQFQKLINQKYSRSWKSKKITTIISDILEKMVGFDFNQIYITDISDEEINFTMPYWNSLQALNWLLNRASSNKKWGYCCFTRRSYDFNESTVIEIKTLESMLQDKTLLQDTNNAEYSISSTGIYDYNRILSYEMSGVDLFSNKQLRGGHITGYDFNRKIFLDNIYQYSTGQDDTGETISDQFTMLGDWTLLKGTEYSNLKDIDVDIQMVGDDNENIIKNIYFNDWNKRYSVQNMINIIVKGHESREIGKLINLKWPSIDSEKQTYNSNLNGKYLIKNITHYFSPKGKPVYKQKIGLIKNAYNYNEIDEKILFPSTKQPEETNKNSILQ